MWGPLFSIFGSCSCATPPSPEMSQMGDRHHKRVKHNKKSDVQLIKYEISIKERICRRYDDLSSDTDNNGKKQRKVTIPNQTPEKTDQKIQGCTVKLSQRHKNE